MPSTRSSDPSVVSYRTPPSATVDKFINLASRAFSAVPLTTAFITEIDSVAPGTPPSSLSPDRLQKHFSLGIPAAAKANVLLVHTEPFTAAALIEPPDFCGIPPSQHRRDPGPILKEWRFRIRTMKAKHLALPDEGPRAYDTPAAPSQSSGAPAEDPFPADFNKDDSTETRPFYHIAILARDPSLDAAAQDAALKVLVEPILAKAQEEGVPVWTEASLVSKKEEFERFGFKAAEEVVIGQGRIDANGWPKENGEGVSCWGLIWEPTE